MSALDDAFEDLRGLLVGVKVTINGTVHELEDGSVFGARPETAVPPFIEVVPGEPFLSFDEAWLTFGEAAGHFAVIAVLPSGANSVEMAMINEVMLQIVRRIKASDRFNMESVDRPGDYPLNNNNYPGIVVRASTSIDLRKE